MYIIVNLSTGLSSCFSCTYYSLGYICVYGMMACTQSKSRTKDKQWDMQQLYKLPETSQSPYIAKSRFQTPAPLQHAALFLFCYCRLVCLFNTRNPFEMTGGRANSARDLVFLIFQFYFSCFCCWDRASIVEKFECASHTLDALWLWQVKL